MDERGFETGWVIELGESEPSHPSYWTGPSENPAFWPFGMFSDDNAKAVRFARKEDAEAVVRFTKMWSHDDPRCHFRVAEHAWDCLPPPDKREVSADSYQDRLHDMLQGAAKRINEAR